MSKRRPRVAVVGAGRVGRVLALCLHKAGYRVTAVVARDEAASQRRAAKVARGVNAQVLTTRDAAGVADIYWLCVPDDDIARVARELSRRGDWKGKLAFHASGALPANELRALRRNGAWVASVHPMHSFLPDSRASMRGIPFGLEGDAAAVRAAEQIARRLSVDGLVYRVRAESKPLYHALGSFSSPLLVSLLEAGEQVGRAAGVADPNPVRWNILRATLDNYEKNGADVAFGGPIRRADIGTLRKHLKALRKLPLVRDIYIALAKNAVERLPIKDRAAVRKLLSQRSR